MVSYFSEFVYTWRPSKARTMPLSVQRPAVSSPQAPSGISVRKFFEEQLSSSLVAFVPKEYEFSEDPTKKLTYLTKDELTQKWHGPPSQCGWVAKNENFWDDEKNQLVHDVGLVVTLVQETKAREIHDFNDFTNGQREALFPVGTEFKVTKYTEKTQGWPKYEFEIKEQV